MARYLTFAAALGLAACDPGSPCGPTEGVVAEVIDGDTIELETGERIRYLMVDTPEITNGKDECFGQEAADLNADLVGGEPITLRYGLECRDDYDRLLAFVSVKDRDVSELLVERGYGCVLFIPPNGEDRLERFESLEQAARDGARGMWGACEEAPCAN